MSPLPRLSDLLRGRPRIDAAELERYSLAIQPLVEQLGQIYVRWRRDLELDSGEDELANAASIQRWEAAGLSDRLRQTRVPSALARSHADLEAIIASTARAAQLLSNGYRYNSSNARCDGQALMLSSEQRFVALCRALARSGVSVEPDADGARAPR